MNKNNSLIFCRKSAICILANFLSGLVVYSFFPLWFLILIFIFILYFSINLLAIVLRNTKKMMLILTLIDGLFSAVLLTTFVYVFIFTDTIIGDSGGWVITNPMGLSIIYFSVSFIRDILKMKKMET